MADFYSPTAKWKMFKRQDSVGKLSLVAGLVQKLRAAYNKYQRVSPSPASDSTYSASLLERIGHQLSHPFAPQHPCESTPEETQHWEFVAALCEVGSAADAAQMSSELAEMFEHDQSQYQLLSSQLGQSDPFLNSFYFLVLPKIRRMFLVLRGSREVDEWLSNLPHSPCESLTSPSVPPGAIAAAQQLVNNSELSAQIASQGYDVVTIIGHSLGGATAVALHQLLKEKLKHLAKPMKCRCITFGSPAFWTRSFSESLKNEVISFVHADDMMPRLTVPALIHIFDPNTDHTRSISPISARHEAEAELVLNSMMMSSPDEISSAAAASSSSSSSAASSNGARLAPSSSSSSNHSSSSSSSSSSSTTSASASSSSSSSASSASLWHNVSISDSSQSSSLTNSRDTLTSVRRPLVLHPDPTSSSSSAAGVGRPTGFQVIQATDLSDAKEKENIASNSDLASFHLPGRVLFLSKDREKLGSYELYTLLPGELSEVRLSPTMIEDHRMKLYLSALRALLQS